MQSYITWRMHDCFESEIFIYTFHLFYVLCADFRQDKNDKILIHMKYSFRPIGNNATFTIYLKLCCQVSFLLFMRLLFNMSFNS